MSVNSNETNRLLQAAAVGDQQAWSALLIRHRQRLRRMVSLRTDERLQGQIDASDVLRRAGCEAAARLAEYLREPNMPFFLWMRSIAGETLAVQHRQQIGSGTADPQEPVTLYRGSLPVLPLPQKLLPTTREPIDVRSFEVLNHAIAGREKLWLVLWQGSLADPTGLVVDGLEQTYHRLGVGRTFHDVALLCFDVSPGPLLPDGAVPQSQLIAELGGQVRFLGYDLPSRSTHPGGTLYLYLYWESLIEMEHDYRVFTQILGEEGQIIAQQDKVAGAEPYPTSRWAPGAIVRDRFLLTVQPQAAPGRYRLIVGLYDPSPAMPRLSVQGEGIEGDHITLGEITIVRE